MSYTLYYRNYLKSCNYACPYCPFAKAVCNQTMLSKDKEYLQRFVEYLTKSLDEFNLFFAPRGEILLYEHYQVAIIKLSKLKNIGEIVIQTNLSSDIEWLNNVELGKVILWASYHPSQVTNSQFFQKIARLPYEKVRCTVGMVGLRENFGDISKMHELLQKMGEKKPYLWVNAYNDRASYYSEEDIKYIEQYDPLFGRNLKSHACKNTACRTSEDVFFLEYDGTIQRCWQDKSELGNIYTDNLSDISAERKCQKSVCGCFIGYSHIKSLQLEKVYANSLLGRNP